jgi:hypothetical protein
MIIKMKLAILICGEYREFELAHCSWDFLTKTDNDVFFSTWNKSIQENKGLDIYIEEEITENKIKEFLPDAFISIVDNGVNKSLHNNTHRMHYHWKSAFKMLEESGNEYTHIILTRPDIFYQNHREEYHDYDDKIQSKVLYGGERITLVGNNVFGVDDTYFVGKYETIKEFITDLPIETEMHHGLAQYIINKGWFVNQLNMGTSIVRGNCRGLDELDMNVVGQKRHEWYVAYHKHQSEQNEN